MEIGKGDEFMRDILQQQAALRENSRRLSQTFEKALVSPLLTPARLRLDSSASTVEPEEEEVVFVEAKNKRKANSPLDPEKFKKRPEHGSQNGPNFGQYGHI